MTGRDGSTSDAARAPGTGPRTPSRWAWPALRGRRFRLFLSGQALGLLGASVQQVALSWLVYRVTGSALLLGVTGFVAGLPAALVAPFAGVLSDRLPPRSLLLATQALAALQAFLLAAIAWWIGAGVPAILVLVALGGIVGGVERPVRQMIVPRLVGAPEHVGSAVASGSLAYDAARVVGPLLGGALVARASEAPVFGLNGVVQLLALAFFLAIPPAPADPLASREPVVASLLQGLRHAARAGPERAILLLSAGISFAGIGYMVLLPLVAEDVLGGGPGTLGLLGTSAAVGSILGGLYFGARSDALRPLGLVAPGAALFGLGLLVVSLSRRTELSVVGLGAVGFGIAVLMTASSTFLLRSTPTPLHGRVMGLFTLSYLALAPVGCLATGFAADLWGPATTIGASGVLCLLLASAFLLHVRSLGLPPT